MIISLLLFAPASGGAPLGRWKRRVFPPLLLSILLVGCSALPKDLPREASQALPPSEQTALGRLLAEDPPAAPDASQVDVLDTGQEALQVRLALVALAERSIDLQYYIWNSDDSGRLLAQALLDAADRGVRVRLLLDDFNVGDRDSPLATLHAHPDIQVRVYNPNASRSGVAWFVSLLGEFGRLNQRMHNKAFVVDGLAAISGGRNIGDEYFDLHPALNFRDRDLFVAGPVVAAIAQGFDEYWNSERSFPVSGLVDELPDAALNRQRRDRLRAYVDAQSIPYVLPGTRDQARQFLQRRRSQWISAKVELLIDQAPRLQDTASSEHKRVAQQLGAIARGASQEILIESAYLILGDEGLELAEGLHRRGIRVSALTNSLASNDLTPNHSGYARRRPQMLEAGMTLYELRPDAASCRRLVATPGRCEAPALFGLHAKSMVFDREKVFVGSFNLNLRSVYLNTEIGLLVHSSELASRVAADIEENMRPENSWHVSLDATGGLVWQGQDMAHVREPQTGWWRRFKVGLLKLLPIEKYL